jgi:hypothetical protein
LEKVHASAIPAEKVTGPALLTGFSGESLRKPVSEGLAASGLAGLAGMAVHAFPAKGLGYLSKFLRG